MVQAESNGHIDFDDLVPIEKEFTLFSKRYVLREASADSQVKFHNANQRAYRYQEGRVASIDGIFDSEPEVVSANLFLANQETGKLIVLDDGITPNPQHRVPVTTIRSWPGRVQGRLFDELKRISPDLIKSGKTKEELIEEREAIDKKLALLEAEKEPAKN